MRTSSTVPKTVVSERVPRSSVRAGHLAVLPPEVQGWPHISAVAVRLYLQVCLKKQPLHLATFDLLLALNLVEGELKGTAGGQPG